MAQDDGKLDSLRRDLYQVIFRGRGRPSVGELLLDNSKRDSISGAQVLESLTSCPPEDVLRLSQVSLLHRTQWYVYEQMR